MERKRKETSIVVRVSTELKKRLQAKADKDRRTLGDFVRFKLEDAIA